MNSTIIKFSPGKLESRDIIIQSYKYYSGNTKLPKNKQFWSLCGECVSDGKLITNSEPDQFIKSGFIISSQYYGIEINEDIHNINKQYEGINWLCGDAYKVIMNTPKPNFNPGIINFDDTTQFPEQTIITFRRIISWINYLKIKNVMVVYNVKPKRKKSNKETQSQMEEVIFGDVNLREYLKEGWILPDQYVEYDNIFSLYFYKK